MAEKTKEQIIKELEEALAKITTLEADNGTLKSENEALTLKLNELSQAKPKGDAKGFTEAEIKEKTTAGLTREQAITVLTTQRDEDAALKKAKK